ncbi:MAG: ligase-associated DNA damage response exonuclease, partial [Maioricimonas sp. JB045]
MIASDLLTLTEAGLYCSAGDFFVDPWRPVPRAVITHAHSDHARQGSARYLTSLEGRNVLATRMLPDAVIDTLDYGEAIDLNGVRLSLHPAGHILGSSQVRIEYRGHVCVVSGDYKVDRDATCTPFELQRCHTFITESTFGLPVYRWPPQEEVMAAVNNWWRDNREAGRTSVIFAYSLGKAQRLIAGLDPQIGPIFCHGAVERVNRDYRDTGISLPPTEYAGSRSPRDYAEAMVVAPPSAHGSPWLRRFGDCST